MERGARRWGLMLVGPIEDGGEKGLAEGAGGRDHGLGEMQGGEED